MIQKNKTQEMLKEKLHLQIEVYNNGKKEYGKKEKELQFMVIMLNDLG